MSSGLDFITRAPTYILSGICLWESNIISGTALQKVISISWKVFSICKVSVLVTLSMHSCTGLRFRKVLTWHLKCVLRILSTRIRATDIVYFWECKFYEVYIIHFFFRDIKRTAEKNQTKRILDLFSSAILTVNSIPNYLLCSKLI